METQINDDVQQKSTDDNSYSATVNIDKSAGRRQTRAHFSEK